MSGWFAVLLALLLPTLAGAGVWVLLAGWPRHRGLWLLACGEGYLLGALLLGNALWAAGPIATAGLLGRWGPGLVAVALLTFGLAWRWRATSVAFERPAALRPAPAPHRRIAWALLALLLGVGVLILWQAVALPTLTWDAWNAWLAKAKAWQHAGAFLPVVGVAEWLARTPEAVLSAVAAPYPEALPRFATWLGSAAGGWEDAHVHIAWPALWLALGLMFAGALRARGLGWLPVMLATAALLTLPLVTAHASLAGYADLWIAAAMLAAGQHAARFATRPGWRSAALAAVFALLLPTIKFEGAVWMLLVLAALGLWLLPARWRIALAGGVIVLLAAAVWLLPAVHLPIPGLGEVVIEGASITVPFVGQLDLFWRDVGGTVAESLFQLPNWSLLWYLLLPLVWWRRRELSRPDAALLAAVLAVGLAFLFVLFFFTEASRWAENLTSLNRLLLHLVPLLLLWLALLLHPPADRPELRGRWA